ncbi:hypothetical protein B0H11DRAFT_1939032 [Mycena galericulata]|nr:hypothetical protein B0H11DRAFT_1939032 [Mycena galericulata]
MAPAVSSLCSCITIFAYPLIQILSGIDTTLILVLRHPNAIVSVLSNRIVWQINDQYDADVERMTEEDWQMFARDHPNAAIPRFDVSDLGTRPLDAAWDVNAARTRWNDVDQMGTYLDQQRRESGAIINAEPDPIDLATLANEQRAIFENYVSAYSKILAGEAIPQMLLNIDGTAGCGKTYLIHAICQELRRMAAEHGEPKLKIAVFTSAYVIMAVTGWLYYRPAF